MRKKVVVVSGTIFNNSQCMFVEYYDVIKCPWFILANCIKDEESISDIFDLAPIRGLSIPSLFEWYINRKNRNFYKDLLIPNDELPEDFCDNILENQMKQSKEFFSSSLELNFANVVRLICRDKTLLHNLIIYTEKENDLIREDIKEMYDGNVRYVSGEFEEIIKTIPRDSTFVFSDIMKVQKLYDLNRLDYSSIIMCSGYRYNNKDKNTLKVDLDDLRTKAVFKIDFFDNINNV